MGEQVKKAALPFQHLFKHGKRQGITFEVKLWAFKKDINEADLHSLEAKVDSLRRERDQSTELYNKLISCHPEAAQASDKLRHDIETNKSKISELRRSSMTVEEAELRLPDLQRASRL